MSVFAPDMLIDAQQRLDLREDLAGAMDRRELTLAYQPLVEMDGRTLSGVEALLRWQHSEHGPIPPDRFIPLAEQTGLIVELGRWVLDRALHDLRTFAELNPRLRVNVNVAPRELVEAVAEALARHGVSPDRLTLELTESQLPEDAEIISRLERLAALGVQLSIDDFGTGQSSLARLQRLPVNQVKLDRSFLSTIDQGPGNATLVRSMVELGHALGLQMVAEGIERESQFALLADLPCQLGQGYLFGRPLASEAIIDLLANTAAAADSDPPPLTAQPIG
jgi:EAL domain-containing protein (putative c-di-GMP-specific phosphodiesterase class I)